ncbi:alanine racemase [Petrotoga sp. 9PW.55.5.1]|uniref:YggS family pyridoxal phosphate-dependent enzyme n=1 Tax=Petrotoga sp. 9PW.55.5.1 TaxID=1308979 RepID=UPI000DC24FAA|nr:YggS family pyridoxal phosphate-dependent enzyme [Petrotoga sp. 9PW.55.5.1]RAO98868.1 alanine racemase [Petrotoga sp. 9PW.55.5.1]
MSNFLIENYLSLKKEIKEISEKCGRNKDEITLVAVSKNFPSEYIKSIYDVEQIDFGENKAQELIDKCKQLKDLNITWHFLGRIQTNKIKYIVPIAEYIHSVCRKKELDEIQKRVESIKKTQKIFLEVNVSGEESKAGLTPHQLKDFLEMATTYKNISVVGLMTMAPFTKDTNIIRNTFSTLREIKNDLIKSYPSIKELSMGMTNDYKIAIEEGATFLRIGTRIFGKRV